MRNRIGIYCDLALQVKDGNEIVLTRADRAHSFTANFGWMIYHGLQRVANSNYRTITNTAVCAAGTYWYDNPHRAAMNILASAGDVTRGICLGTSNTPFSTNQYALQAPIAHGSGTGQLTHAVQGALPSQPSVVGSDILLELSRDFANNSTASITVKEIGLLGYALSGGTYYGNLTFTSQLYLRDVVADTPVASGQVLNVKYIIKTTV